MAGLADELPCHHAEGDHQFDSTAATQNSDQKDNRHSESYIAENVIVAKLWEYGYSKISDEAVSIDGPSIVEEDEAQSDEKQFKYNKGDPDKAASETSKQQQKDERDEDW